MTNRKEYKAKWYIRNRKRLLEEYAANKQMITERKRKDRARNLEKQREYERCYRQKLKLEVLSSYSGNKQNPLCACCGENNIHFLSIDHINNDGHIHRKIMRYTGLSFYQWLKRNKYPTGFQVLCHNCNMGKSVARSLICPHHFNSNDTIMMRKGDSSALTS